MQMFAKVRFKQRNKELPLRCWSSGSGKLSQKSLSLPLFMTSTTKNSNPKLPDFF